MLNRRSLIGLSVAMPVAGNLPRLDLPDPRVDELNTGGVHVIGISPDASLLVGVRERESICILDANSLEILAESDPIVELSLLDERLIAWSPDRSRIAFSLMPWLQMRDSDIFLMDVNTGEVTNLTPEGNGEEAHRLLEENEASVDMSPVWLDDDTLIFASHRFAENEDIATVLMKLTISDGEIDTWVDLGPAGVRFVNQRIWQVTDGSLVFEVDIKDDRSQRNSVMIVSPDGNLNEIDVQGLGHVTLVDVNDTYLIVNDVTTFDYLLVPLDDPAKVEKLCERFELPGTVSMLSDPVFGPKSETVLLAAKTEKDQKMVYLLDESGATQVAELQGESGSLTCRWAEDVILITSKGPSWLIEPEA